jgi:hypothetical protein
MTDRFESAVVLCIHCGVEPVAVPYRMFCSDACHSACLSGCGARLQVTDAMPRSTHSGKVQA